MSKNHAWLRGIGQDMAAPLTAVGMALFLAGDASATATTGERSGILYAQAASEPLPEPASDSDLVSISPLLDPAPELFDGKGIATWDGRRTLRGVWVAHPLAQSARRVRIYNLENGAVVDGALFKRDTAKGETSVIVSSDAARHLALESGKPTQLRIVAVRPAQRPVPDTAVAEASRTPKPDAESDENAASDGAETDSTSTDDKTAKAPPIPAARPAPAAAETLVADDPGKTAPDEKSAETGKDGREFRFVAADTDDGGTPAVADGYFKRAPEEDAKISLTDEKPDDPPAEKIAPTESEGEKAARDAVSPPVRTLALATEEEKQAAAGKPVTRGVPKGDVSGFVAAPETMRAEDAPTRPDAAKSDTAPDEVEVARADPATPPIPAARRTSLSDDKTFRFEPETPPKTADAKAEPDIAAAEPTVETDTKAPEDRVFKLAPQDPPEKPGGVATTDTDRGKVNQTPDAPPDRPVPDSSRSVKTDTVKAAADENLPVFRPAIVAETPKAEPEVKIAAAPTPGTKTPETKTVEAKAAAPKEADRTFKFEPAPSADIAKPGTLKPTAERAGTVGPDVAKADTSTAKRSTLRRPFIQAGLFGVPENASKLIARLKKQGIPATAKSFRSNGKRFSRVVAGPFDDRATRDKAQRVIRGMGLRDAVPVRR